MAATGLKWRCPSGCVSNLWTPWSSSNLRRTSNLAHVFFNLWVHFAIAPLCWRATDASAKKQGYVQVWDVLTMFEFPEQKFINISNSPANGTPAALTSQQHLQYFICISSEQINRAEMQREQYLRDPQWACSAEAWRLVQTMSFLPLALRNHSVTLLWMPGTG